MFDPQRLRVALFLAVSIGILGVFWIAAGPIPQDQMYYNFADQRPMIGMPHALNVLSNLPFIIVGVVGMVFLAGKRSRRAGIFLEPIERWPYWVFFIGLVLTGIGSSYFHANPNDATLVWDRAGLAITFMALFTSILTERVDVRCARWALAPLVLFGIGSVFYWGFSERMEAGDLRPYLIAQFFPLVILPVLLIFFPARYTHAGDLIASLLCYGLAKALEILDRQVYTGSGIISGHTMKHLVAGLSAAFILSMLVRRKPRVAPREALAPASLCAQ
jgi:hypothetical protein